MSSAPAAPPIPSPVLRTLSLCFLALSGWMCADGLRRAGAGAALAGVYFPLDADRLPENASEARILSLRPVSPFARFRDAMGRADGPDVEAFRLAARGALRWGRNQPGVLLDLGRVALARAVEHGEAADRELGEALLLEYTGRTTHAEGEGLKTWLEVMDPGHDPLPVFRGAPRRVWPVLGAQVAADHPEAAWAFLEPSLRDRSLDLSLAPYVVSLAKGRGSRVDPDLLESLRSRPGLPADLAADLAAVIDALRRTR